MVESITLGLSISILLLFAIIWGVALAGLWKIFIKAGHPGWAALVPFYNLYILCVMTGRPGWWVALTLVPVLGAGVLLLIALDLGNAFRRSGLFAICTLWLFPAAGLIVLGFGDGIYAPTQPMAIPKMPKLPQIPKFPQTPAPPTPPVPPAF